MNNVRQTGYLGFAEKNGKIFGFSIIEVVIALGITSILLSVIITLFINIITINKSAAYYSAAYKMIDSNIENLRAGGFDSLDSATCTATGLPEGTCTPTVTNLEDGLKKVEIVISWNFKKSRSITAVTYIAREGIRR